MAVTSYEVGAVFRISDQATAPLLKISAELSKLQKQLQGVKTAFDGLTTLKLGNLSRAIGAVEKNLSGLGQASTKAMDLIVASSARADGALTTTATRASNLKTQLAEAAAAAKSIVVPQRPRVRPGGGGGSTPGTPGGGGGSGGGSGGHGNANWQHVGIGLGMGGFIGVHEITHSLRSVLDAGGEYQHVLTGIQKQNATKEEIAAAVAASRKLSQTIAGVTETEALEAYGTNRGIFGHKDAMAMMKPLLEYTQVIGSTTGDYAGATKKVYDMTRAADLMGKLVNPETHEVDTEQFKHFLELGSKVTLGTHGKVDASTWLGLAQQGGPALSGMSDKGLITMGMVSQIMGGQRGGTALTSMYQQMVGGKMTKSAAEKLKELGVVGDFEVGRGGHVSFGKDSLNTPFTNELKEDPLKAVETLKKAMEAQGLTSIEQQVPKLFEILGRQTTQRLVHDLLRNAPQMIGERDRILGSKGIDESRQLQNDQDYKQAEHNFTAALKNFTTALGQPGVQTAVDAMNSLGRGLNYIAAAASANPGATKLILEGLTGLGIAFGALAVAGVVAGAALLIPGGAVAVAVTTLVGVMGTIAAFNWSAVGGTLEKLDKSFNEIALAFGDQLKSLPGKLATAIAEMGAGLVTAIGDMLKSLFKSLNPFTKTSFEGGEGGAGFQNASFTTGGGANDNFGGSVGRALGRGAGGGGGGAAFDSGVTNSIKGGVAGRAHHVMDRLIAQGWTREAAAAAAGNFVQESAVLPNGRSGDSGTAHGLAQWRFDRWDAAKAYMRAHPNLSPLDAQIDFFNQERIKRGGIQAQMHRFTDVDSANRAMKAFERYGDNSFGQRAGNARGLLRSHMPGASAPAPTAGPPPQQKAADQKIELHVDGKKMSGVVVKHIASASKYPKHIGGMDTHGGWRPPGTTLTDAA